MSRNSEQIHIGLENQLLLFSRVKKLALWIFLPLCVMFIQYYLPYKELVDDNTINFNTSKTFIMASAKKNSHVTNFKNTTNNDIIVETEYGLLAGFTVLITDSTNASAFLGIPFARPPTGKLRFEKPEPPFAWSDVRQAKHFSPSCIPIGFNTQLYEREQSEDCLYLNVFTPQTNNCSVYWPVLFFIHGGAFELGNAADFGYDYFVKNYVSRGLVVVTIQYRLAHFGFASNGNSNFAGNYGMWDVRAALLYVKKNIAKFCGNPDSITVWGHSAGSAIAGHLTLSTHTRDLFHRSIQMGASCFGEWAFNDRVVEETRKIANQLNCELESNEMKTCLQTKSVEEIMNATAISGLTRKAVNFIKFSPRLDGDFFEDDISVLLQNANKKPTLMGISDAEALLFTLLGAIHQIHDFYIPAEYHSSFTAGSFYKFVTDFVLENGTRYQNDSNAHSIIHEICTYYLLKSNHHSPNSWKNIYDHPDYVFYLKQYTKIISDIIFVVPILMESHAKMAKNWPVYLYQLSYSRQNMFPKHIPIKSSTHGVEYPHLFGIQLMHSTNDFNSDDERFKETLLTMIETFAKTMKPLINDTIEWQALSEKQPFVHFNLDVESTIKNTTSFFSETIRFWKRMKSQFGFDIARMNSNLKIT